MKVLKTIKLFMNGEFPRTESGRSYPVFFNKSNKEYARLCMASKKDLRNAVEFAKASQPAWAKRSAYNRGQILYRIAEMMEGKREELSLLLQETQGISAGQTKKQIDQSIDHFIHFAGMSDKYEQILGSKNPINGPFHNFTSPVAIGVVGIVLSEHETLDQVSKKLAATIVSGNSLVLLLNKKTEILLSTLGEILKTSDLPAGVVNLLSGELNELCDSFFSHMEIKAIGFERLDKKHLTKGRELGSTHLKRINDLENLNSIHLLEKTIEFKTYWHPIGQ